MTLLPICFELSDARLMPGWQLSGGICGVGQGAYLIHWSYCHEEGVLDLGNNWREQMLLSSQVVASLSRGYSSRHWPRPCATWCNYEASTQTICQGPLHSEELCEAGDCSERTLLCVGPGPPARLPARGWHLHLTSSH